MTEFLILIYAKEKKERGKKEEREEGEKEDNENSISPYDLFVSFYSSLPFSFHRTWTQIQDPQIGNQKIRRIWQTGNHAQGFFSGSKSRS